MRKQQVSIRFHPHALDRLRQRFPGARKERLRGRLRQRIAAELKKGVQPDWDGAIRIETERGSGVWVICYASLMGGWEIKTIYPGWEDKDMSEERAIYGEDIGSGHVRLSIDVPVPVAEVFKLKNTSIDENDIRLIIRAMKNDSMLVNRIATRERLVELSLIFENFLRTAREGEGA